MANAVFADHEPHPPINWSVTDILVNSSNVGTIMVGQKLGKTKLDHYLRAFGFGKKTDVGFPGEPAGLLLDPDHWYVTSMGTVPIGNGLAVSALQMLQVYVTVANGGMYRPPKLLEATIDADGARHAFDPGPAHRVISAETAAKLSTMLTKVVQEGTGSNAVVPGYLAAGKTGTARKPLEGARGYSGNYVATFVGFVPAQDPRLAAVVVLDEPTPIYGGQVAAPVFARIMQYALRLERSPAGDRPAGPGPGQAPATPSTRRRPTTTPTSRRRPPRRPPSRRRRGLRPRRPRHRSARPPSRRRPRSRVEAVGVSTSGSAVRIHVDEAVGDHVDHHDETVGLHRSTSKSTPTTTTTGGGRPPPTRRRTVLDHDHGADPSEESAETSTTTTTRRRPGHGESGPRPHYRISFTQPRRHGRRRGRRRRRRGTGRTGRYPPAG